MTGPEHYKAAEKYLSVLDAEAPEDTWVEKVSSGEMAAAMAAAQVHATLALAASAPLADIVGILTAIRDEIALLPSAGGTP